ncbi:MAG: peptidyl-prolyl cis-trans isomerase [Pseudohongiellaceae bacterium]
MSESLRTALREPTLHFLLIAGLVFAVFQFSQSNEREVLELSAREIEARVMMQELNRGSALTEDERQAVVDAYIEEQILVQEALARNLDNDARIHDLLAQKMLHVLSGDVIQPSTAQLQEYYAANAGRYRIPALVTLDELVFNTPEPLPESVQAQLAAGAEPDVMLAAAEGDVSTLRGASQLDLTNIFSAAFAEQVMAAELGQWVGPFQSNRGQHWLRPRQRQEASTPPLAEISERLRLDWIATEEQALLAEQVNAIKARYNVVIEAGGDHQ